MRVLYLLSDYPLHNSLLPDTMVARPEDQVAVIKIPLVLKGKGRRDTAERILPQLSRRFVVGKLLEFVVLMTITLLPKLTGRGPSFMRLRRICKRARIPFLRSENVMSPASLEFITGFAPDVIISLCHQILKEPLISIPPLGIVNIHPGILPDFKGIQPYFWELSEGASHSGATLHLIEDEGIDTGRILARTRHKNTPGLSVQVNYALTIRAATKILPEVLEGLAQGTLAPEQQNPALGNYYRWPDSAAFDRLQEKGHPLISLPQLTRFLLGRI